MSPYQAIALSAGVFAAVVSGQVALARRGRLVAAASVALVAVLAMAGLSVAIIAHEFADSGSLPAEIVRAVVLTGASFWGIPLLATTLAAVWLARRVPRPRIAMHWAATAAAGLLMYPVTIPVRERFGFDMMNAVDDGTAPRVVTHPTPEERRVIARTLPDCSIPRLTTRTGKWRWESVSRIAGRLPMPAEMHEESGEPDESDVHQWEHGRWGTLVLVFDTAAQYSAGFSVSGGTGTTTEPSCGLRVGSTVVPIKRSAATVFGRHGGMTSDSAFAASTDIPFALPDTQIGVGIVARSRAGRDTLLSILAAMQVVDRKRETQRALPASPGPPTH